MDQLRKFKSIYDTRLSCILFVKRRYVAFALSMLINREFGDEMKSMPLVGQRIALKFMNEDLSIISQNQQTTLEKFANGEYQIIVATTVAEEGLDIRACNLVIRFNPLETLSSYVQSRGRARHNESQYVVMLDNEGGEDNNYEKFKSIEKQLGDLERDEATYSTCVREASNDRVYTNEKTGAKFTTQSAVQLLKYYCDLLPKDEYTDLKPHFSDIESPFKSENGHCMFKCTLILPICSPLREITSKVWSVSKLKAKKDVCFEACIELYLLGALNDHFVPAIVGASKAIKPPEEEVDQDLSSDFNFKPKSKRRKIRVRNFVEREITSHWSLPTDTEICESSEITAYVYELVSTHAPNVKFSILTLKHLPLSQSMSLELQVGSYNRQSLSISELGSQKMTIQQLSICEQWYCALMSSVVVGKHREKLYSPNEAISPVIALPSTVFGDIVSGNSADANLHLSSDGPFRVVKTLPETITQDLEGLVVVQQNGSLVSFVHIFRNINLKKREYFVADESKGVLYFHLLRLHRCDTDGVDPENCDLCIFKRGINIKNVHRFGEQEAVDPEFKNVEFVLDGDRLCTIKFQSYLHIEYCVDVFRHQYKAHVIPMGLMVAGATVPIALHEFESLMIAQDCIEDLVPDFQDPVAMATALSMTSAQSSVDYERLETLGDR